MNMTKMKVNIFLDDIRETPAGFIRTYTVDETIKEGKNVIRIVSNESTKFYERVKNENGTYSYTLIK